MTERDAESAPIVIRGATFIYDKLACVLIDPGTTFSFTSSTFVLYNKFELAGIDEHVLVNMPMGVSVICDKVIKDVMVKISDDEMEWDFIPLPLSDFNTILSIDRLSHYIANVDCFEK